MEIELKPMASDEESLHFSEKTVSTEDFDSQLMYENDINNLKSTIQKRKLANIVYGISTLALLGTDIANTYWSEKTLFEQRISHNYVSIELQPCECPNRTISCITSTGLSCELTFGSLMLYGINDIMPIWRMCNGITNMYYLSVMQQALETGTITKKIENIPIIGWVTQLLSAAALGGFTSMAATLNGIHSYPRTVATWGMNALIDAFGTSIWYGNSEAVRELVAFEIHTGTKL